jgi:TetR/AcrR family transcriptional regulator, cholesterol catabolism regulator
MVRRDTHDTLERLYESAIELIAEHGYAGTTVDEIVARAGVAKGTVYYHFKSKAELVTALLEDGLKRLATSFRDEIAGVDDPVRALSALVHAELAFIQRYQAFSKLVMSEMWRVDRDWQTSASMLRDGYVSVFTGVLSEGVEAGAFRVGLDAQAAASAIFGLVATTALDWLVFAPERHLDDVETALTAMVLGAVGAD